MLKSIWQFQVHIFRCWWMNVQIFRQNNIQRRVQTDGQVENNILLKLREKLMPLRQFRNSSIFKDLPLRWIFLWILTDTVTVDKCQLDYASTVTCFLFSFYAIQFIGNMYQILLLIDRIKGNVHHHVIFS